MKIFPAYTVEHLKKLLCLPKKELRRRLNAHGLLYALEYDDTRRIAKKVLAKLLTGPPKSREKAEAMRLAASLNAQFDRVDLPQYRITKSTLRAWAHKRNPRA
jgi:hypothetical protein